MRAISKRAALVALALSAVSLWATASQARIREGDPEYQDLQGLEQQFQVGPYAPPPGSARLTHPMDIPDIFGPGAVLTVGNVFMKCTNYGLDGNAFPNLSSDPSGQWPGASAVEYLSYIGLAVGAVNPFAQDPTAVRRVSYITEWRPPTLDPEDRMYKSYDGMVGGQRFVNDDGDVAKVAVTQPWINDAPLPGEALIDEDFLDGRDNDGDGLIDEDFGALGQEMWTCLMRDDTPQAINAAAAERHVPLGLECRKSDWAYSIPGYTDFNVINYDIYNVSGHILDSVYVGIRSDLDCGPIVTQGYWTDDFNLSQYPQGVFMIQTAATDLRLQPASDRAPIQGINPDSALCPRYKVSVSGWSTVDDNGDQGKTPGIGTVMLIDHTIDPTGMNGPSKVGLRAFRSFINGTPYQNGGNPTIDQQRYEFMTGFDPSTTTLDPALNHIDPTTGFINQPTGDNKGDYSDWASVGPWLLMPPGAHVSVTIAFGVSLGSFSVMQHYPQDYAAAVSFTAKDTAVMNPLPLMQKYPSLANAIAAQVAFQGAYEVRSTWPHLTDFYGRETPVIAPPGQLLSLGDCHDDGQRTVDDKHYTWFDFDCDYCTGAYSKAKGGLFHHTWLASSPPPSPNTNMSIKYNYAANPDRRFPPEGDRQITLAWDNLSETTPDPKSGQFDFRGYKIWKVSGWQRPVGSAGPGDNDWTLLATYTMFDAHDNNATRCPHDSAAAGVCDFDAQGDSLLYPLIYVPQTGQHIRLRLKRGDMWDAQSGLVLSADSTVHCTGYPSACDTVTGFALGQSTGSPIAHNVYPVGRYHVVDHEVKDGFIYFYAVSAFDSTGSGSQISELESRRSAVEAEGVTPQAAADTISNGAHVWVVPNPYRGNANINSRPSAWDLTPNATDPTGTHIDFFGLPRGAWRIKIFTVSGDLVQTLHWNDPINDSIRSPITVGTTTLPGYNTQEDTPNDGEARWNLISRNGQDVVSGIYLFTVDVNGSVKHRGKFVIIR